jgi:ABC-2 type transport system ATP-binding protein
MYANEPVAVQNGHSPGQPILFAQNGRAAVRVADYDVALNVEGMTKYFGKERERGTRLPWQRHKPAANGANGVNGSGAPNGHDDGKKVVAVDNVSLRVPRGEIFGILGPNGSGKSTLIRCISTLLVPDSGCVTVFGLDVQRDEMAVKRLINRVSVEASFFKKLSPMENLIYAARLYGLSPDYAAPEARRILERLDLPARTLKQSVEDLSRGQQQKIAIARALLTAPVLLLLDEPTTGLDPRSKHEVQAFVTELRDRHDATILLTTHDMYEADALCDRVAIIHDGKLVAMDTPEALKARVANGSGKTVTLEEVFMALTGKQLVSETNAVEAS